MVAIWVMGYVPKTFRFHMEIIAAEPFYCSNLSQSPMVMISVVIPCYNEERYLPRCIKSILAQSYRDFEVIFVDDGSYDGTKGVLESASAKSKKIRFHRQKNAGPGAARNKGVDLAKGDILVFVDADMTFHREYLRVLTGPIRAGKAFGTTHTKELVANKDNLWARSWSVNRIPESVQSTGSGVYRAIRKDRFIEAGGFDPRKGYFDDDLSKLGLAVPVPAICYHNNPETLGEAFRHSLWVGGSLVRNRRSRRRYSLMIIASWITVALILALVLAGRTVISAGIVLLVVVLVAGFLLAKAIPRAVDERRPEYLISIPILWLVRLAGYYAGAMRRLLGGS